jgi:hypothetical protein
VFLIKCVLKIYLDGDQDEQFTITYTVENNVNIATIQLRDPDGPGLDSDAGIILYTLTVVATNTAAPPTGVPNPESIIIVTINVRYFFIEEEKNENIITPNPRL